MHERDIKLILDAYTPAPDETGDWDAVVADAHDGRRGGVGRTRRLRWPKLLAAVVVAAGLIVGVPTLAASQDWWFFQAGAPKATGSVVQVQTISASDKSTWVLTAYVSQHDGLCVGINPTTGGSEGAAMNCGAGVVGEPDQPADSGNHAIGYTISQGGTRPRFLFGLTSSAAQRVRVAFADGTTVDVDTIAAPSALGAPVRFYATEAPSNKTPTDVTAVDGAGRTLEHRVIP